jgi:hypothetical protein
VIRPPRVVGRRGACLLFFALLDFVYGLSLSQPAAAMAPTTRFVASIAPLPWWAGLWISVGVICLAGAFAHRLDRAAFCAAAGIKTLWGGVLLLGWAISDVTRGWVSAAVWCAFAALVVVLAGWPEPITFADRPDD